MQKTFAYIDEYGNHDLDTTKKGASKFFILVAVLIPEEKIKDLKSSTELIRKKYFQTGEMKSSGIGNNHKRRISVLNSTKDLEFTFYSLVVDKDRINKDSGLKYKKSFLKYLNGKVYKKLFSGFNDIHIIADEHGSEAYKDSFRRYIEKHHKPDMFYRASFDLVQSKDHVLVQLADLIVGSISKIYEDKASQSLTESYLTLIKQKCIGLDEWPTKFQAYYPPDTTTDEFSQLIFSHSLASAEIFIEEHESNPEEDIRLQVATARFFIFHSRWINKDSYISTKAIQEHLHDSGYGKVTEQKLRSSIIAKLRDSDVIISSSNKGYKIPSSFKDMETFVETVNSKIKPLLERLGRARANLKLASHGEIDILKGPNSPHLVTFIETLEKQKK